ncbi:MAG TPA: 3'-5' exonuclease, partial [Flavobacterium sp.]|nr:3'-5' exonuclease [Flavobacterium sp.]
HAGITDFLNYWEKNIEKVSIPSPENKDAVKIMTIHKAKGLEFPIVIMPFAEEDYGRSPKDKLWLDPSETSIDLPKVLIDNSKAVESYGEDAKLIFNQKKQEELLDNINILYVALTRAKEHLYVISNMNLKANGEVAINNMSSLFINYLIHQAVFDSNKMEYEFGNPIKLTVSEKSAENVKIIPFVNEILNQKNIKIAQNEALMWGSDKQDGIEYGNLIHEILSFIKTKKDIDLAIIKALEKGLITLNQENEIFKTIDSIVNHDDLICFFNEENEVLNEKTIIQKEGELVKPDKMVISKDKKVYLLDYKTGKEKERDIKQINNYQNAIENMGYKVVKKSLIYIGGPIKIVNL